MSHAASLLLLCAQFKHGPLLWLICPSAGVVDLFVVVAVLFFFYLKKKGVKVIDGEKLPGILSAAPPSEHSQL